MYLKNRIQTLVSIQTVGYTKSLCVFRNVVTIETITRLHRHIHIQYTCRKRSITRIFIAVQQSRRIDLRMCSALLSFSLLLFFSPSPLLCFLSLISNSSINQECPSNLMAGRKSRQTEFFTRQAWLFLFYLCLMCKHPTPKNIGRRKIKNCLISSLSTNQCKRVNKKTNDLLTSNIYAFFCLLR